MTLKERALELYGTLTPDHQHFLKEKFTNLGEMSPDGWRYFEMARGSGAPKPYHYRWLLPKILGEDRSKWAIASASATILMVPAMKYMTGKWSPGLFVFTLDGVWWMARSYPVITDPVAMLAAIVAAGAVKHKHWCVAVPASLIAGASKEIAPVFAAIYCQHPLPLIGMVSPVIMTQIEPGQDITDDFSHECVEYPVRSSWITRRGKSKSLENWIYNWGGLLAGIRSDARTMQALILAYTQTIVGVDNDRLVQWAWPVLADNVTDSDKWPMALIVSHFNPKRSPA